MLLTFALLATVTALMSATPAANAELEGPDAMPWTGSPELWCSWSNPSIFNNCTGYHPTPALDVGMARGTPIYAAGPGDVAEAVNGCQETAWTCGSGAGNYVSIKHPNGIYSRYLHLTSEIVSVGQKVDRGQLIGYSGATGSVCQPTPCPHLHYDEVDSIISVHRVDPGPMTAIVDGAPVTYPQVLGKSSWSEVPYGTLLHNDGFLQAPGPASNFHPLVPFRVLDSRTATGGWGSKIGQKESRELDVTTGGVPDNASAVVLNVTATNATAPSFLTVYPAQTAVPTASNLNFGGSTVPNMVVARVGPNGNIAIYNEAGSVDVVVDVVGYLDSAEGDHFVGLSPTRTLDSRDGAGGWLKPLGAGEERAMMASGVGGLPATASSIVMNVTVTGGTANSFLKAFPTGAALPITSNLNFAAGQTVSNLVVSQIGQDGMVSLYNEQGSVDVVVDVVGYFDPFAPGGHFHPMAPIRVLDNRIGLGSNTNAWGQDESRSVVVAGVGGVPSDAAAVVVNLTATNGDQGSYLTAYPTGQGMPMASNLLFGPHDTVPNLVMVPVGTNGSISIYNQKGSVDVVADVVGYYAAS